MRRGPSQTAASRRRETRRAHPRRHQCLVWRNLGSTTALTADGKPVWVRRYACSVCGKPRLDPASARNDKTLQRSPVDVARSQLANNPDMRLPLRRPGGHGRVRKARSGVSGKRPASKSAVEHRRQLSPANPRPMKWWLSPDLGPALRRCGLVIRPLQRGNGFVVASCSHPRRPALLFAEQLADATVVWPASNTIRPGSQTSEGAEYDSALRQISRAVAEAGRLPVADQRARIIQALLAADRLLIGTRRNVVSPSRTHSRRNLPRGFGVTSGYIKVAHGGLPGLGKRH
jgi:hypothetical protein